MTNTLHYPLHSPSHKVFSAFGQENFSQGHDSPDDYQFDCSQAPHIHHQALFEGVSASQLNYDFDFTEDDYNNDFLSSLDHPGPSSFSIQPRYESSPMPSHSLISHPSLLSDANPPASTTERKYALRAAARRGIIIPQTWYDEDDSGTYNPAAERRRAIAPRKRKLSALNGKAKSSSNSIEEEQKEPSLVATFRFASYKAREVLLKCSDSDPDANRDAYPTTTTTSSSASHQNGILNHDEDEYGAGPSSPPSRHPHRHQSQNHNARLPPPIPDPLGLVPDLRHHPAARGCKICRARNTPCPLQYYEGSYPCTYCVIEEVPCELLIPPAVKGACQHCLQLHRTCSYLDDGTAEGPCDECAEEWESAGETNGERVGVREPCLAGPAPGARSRAWIELLPVKERKFRACTACRQVKKRCSLKSKTANPPCKACRAAGIACTFTEILRTNKGKRAMRDVDSNADAEAADEIDDGDAAQQQEEEPSHDAFSRLSLGPSTPRPCHRRQQDFPDPESPEEAEQGSPSPSVFMTDAAGHRGLTTTITTSFVHPISFNYPFPQDCHFCSSPAFPLFGLGTRSVYAIAWSSGLGFTELVGGHGADGAEPSRMCAQCTGERAQVVLCPRHDFVLIPGAEEQDLEEAMERLIGATVDENGDGEKETARWCAVCFGLAGWVCGKHQDGNLLGGGVEGGEEGVDWGGQEGCGLRLCERCVGWLIEGFGNDLDRMVETLQRGVKVGGEEMETKELVLRADAEFLRTDGLLMRNLTAMAEAGVEAEAGSKTDVSGGVRYRKI